MASPAALRHDLNVAAVSQAFIAAKGAIQEACALTSAMAMINLWNRLQVSGHQAAPLQVASGANQARLVRELLEIPMIRWPALSLALVLLPLAAHAQPARPKSTATKPATNYELCLASASGMSTAGMIECGAAEIKVQDARLNRAYSSDMTDMAQNPAGKAALLKAQRAWIAFRDADCATIRAVSGGTIASIYVQSCYLEHTVVRADALEDLLKP